MKNECPGRLVFLILIAGRGQKSALTKALAKSGMKLIHTIYGKGTVKESYLLNVLGLIPEVNKVVITGLLPRDHSDAVFRMLVDQFDFDKPNTGIAFTIPADKIAY